MTDDLSGLPAELRKAALKAAVIANQYNMCENTKISEIGNKLWLPAVLAAQVIRNIKASARWLCHGCNSIWENHGDDAKCGNCGKERKLWIELKKVEEAFK